MKPVLIVGGGISGLSTAYWLTKEGVPCKVVEKRERVGGLLETKSTPFGVVEMAANGFLAQAEILELCKDLEIPLAGRKKERKRRYIFRRRPRRWPLTFQETLQVLIGLLKGFFTRSYFFKVEPYQSVGTWAEQKFGSAAKEWLISPALQGVYAGNVERMSAHMTFQGFGKRKKTKLKGTVAPVKGMGQMIESLEKWLLQNQVQIIRNKKISFIDKDAYAAVVYATSPFDLEEIAQAPDLEVEALPLVSATLFFEKKYSDLQGFGCLFPRREGFYSLGVLFNNCIFEGRSQKRSETWILGGAFHKGICNFSDQEIIRQIKEDRLRLYGLKDHESLLHFEITRWEKALPHVTVDLEKQIERLQTESQVYLTGNYLGRIGLSQIVARNKQLAKDIKKDLSHVS